MKHHRFLLLFIAGVIACFTTPCGSFGADCETLVRKAETIRNDIKIDLSNRESRNAYRMKLENIRNSLLPCLEKPMDASLNLRIKTVYKSIEGKIRELNKRADFRLPGSCGDCSSLSECKAVCERWKRENQFYRKKYRSKLEPFDTLTCDDCLQYLHDFYAVIGDINAAEANEEKAEAVSEELLNTLWGVLYRISQEPSCVEKGSSIIRKMMFPHTVTAEELLEILPDRLEGLTEQQHQSLITKIKNLPEEKEQRMVLFFMEVLKNIDSTSDGPVPQPPPKYSEMMSDAIESGAAEAAMLKDFPERSREEWIHFFSTVFTSSDPNTIYSWQRLFKSVNAIESKQQRKTIIETIPDMKWDRLIDLLNEMKTVEGRQGTIAVNNFMLTDSPEPGDLKIAERLNSLFRETLSRKYQSPVETTPQPLFEQNVYVLKIGDRVTRQAARKPDENLFFRVFGGIKRTRDGYLVMIRFLSGNDLVIYSENAAVSSTIDNTEETAKKLEAVVDNFENFRKTLSLTSGRASGLMASDLEKIEAYISKSVYQDRNIYRQMNPGEVERIGGVYIQGDTFWGDNRAAVALFGLDIRDLVTERINQWYFHQRLNSLLLNTPTADCLKVKGTYEADHSEGYSSVKISYYTVSEENPVSENVIFFPKLLYEIEDEKVEAIKVRLVTIITKTLADYLGTVPETERALLEHRDIVKNKPEVDYVRAFLMPGYLRTACEEDVKWPTKVWNWSNYSLLGLSLGAQLMFIYSDYEEDSYYWAGMAGLGLFAVNGLIGVYDAYSYEPPPAFAPRVSIGGSIWKPAVMVSFDF